MKYLAMIPFFVIVFFVAISGSYWLLLFALWFAGWMISYIWKIDEYMIDNNITDMRLHEDDEHYFYANEVFLKMSYAWPFWIFYRLSK